MSTWRVTGRRITSENFQYEVEADTMEEATAKAKTDDVMVCYLPHKEKNEQVMSESIDLVVEIQ